MKNISKYIKEAKFDFNKSYIEFPGFNLKVQKKYLENIDFKTRILNEEFLIKYFGWINQWLDKNVKVIAEQVAKENSSLPKKIKIELPYGLYGDLYLEWNAWWRDGKPSGKLISAEIEVGRICPANISISECRAISEDLYKFRLKEEINF